MDNDILQRISRIYTAIGAIVEDEPSKLKATVVTTDKFIHVFQNFRGNLSDDDLSNYAHTVIHNIANLRNHLRKWASRNGHEEKKIDQTVGNSLELQILIDLSNNDKHGYPPRNGGESQKSPRLVNINRLMQLKTQAKKGSNIIMTLGADGVPKFIGDGTAKAIITGDVVDNKNNRIGDLYKISIKAIESLEQLLLDFGLINIKNDK